MAQQIKSDFEPLYQVEKLNCEKILESYLENVKPKEEKDKQILEEILEYIKLRSEVVETMTSEINGFISSLPEPTGITSKWTNCFYNTMIRKISVKLLYERQKFKKLEENYNELVNNELDIAKIIEQAAEKIENITLT